jgi:hypothetical protein
MTGRDCVVAGVVGTMALVFALLFIGSATGLALLAYVLLLGGLALLAEYGRLQSILPRRRRFEQLLERKRPAEEQLVEQLHRVQSAVAAAGWSEAELHSRLRPIVREIVRVRLSRAHGVDLDRQPERARVVLGEGPVWELARPERELPDDPRKRGWSALELGKLLDAREAI